MTKVEKKIAIVGSNRAKIVLFIVEARNLVEMFLITIEVF